MTKITITEHDIPPSPDQLADILEAAADWFIDHPWLQGGPHGPDGARCVVSSVSFAAVAQARRLSHEGDEIRVGWAHYALTAVQQHLGRRRVEHISVWNDAPERTLDEVDDALRTTAKKVREGDIVV